MLAAVLGAAMLAAGCGASSGQGGSSPQSAPVVLVTEVQPVDVPIFAEIAAQTYARDTVEVRGRVAGYIDKWLFKPGAEVKAGQVLYELDLRPYEAAVAEARGSLRQSEADLEFARNQVALAQAEANLASAEANYTKALQDYERLKPLAEADAASKQDLDAATAALRAQEATVAALKANVQQTKLSTKTQIAAMEGKVEALRAALRNAELNREYAIIRAPISGRIGDSLVPVGGLVSPNSAQPLTTIVPLDPIWVRFKMPEAEYLSWANRGRAISDLPVTLILADGSEFPFKGKVENSLNEVDPKTGTLELQARFPNPKHTVLPGQFGRVRVQVDYRKGVLVIPQRAVQQLQNLQRVYTVGPDNTIEVRAVVTGDRTGDGWVIEQGLKASDRVVVEGQMKVRPGMRVTANPYTAQGK
ncbi:MAG: efflux RND transporter periplasmic adaptor subunit [bacterium]